MTPFWEDERYDYITCIKMNKNNFLAQTPYTLNLCGSLVFFLLLYLVLLSYTLIPYNGLFHPPLTWHWSLYPLLYLTLVSFTLLYLVLVFLPSSIPYTGLFHPPLPCTGLFTHSYTLYWSLSNSSTWCWSFYLILYLVLVFFLLLYLSAGLLTYSYTIHLSLS